VSGTDDRPRAATLAVHAGERQELPRRAAAVPVVQTAPFVFATLDELEEAFAAPAQSGLYSRYANPTVRAVEEKLAALEGAEDAVAFASGMAALAAALSAVVRSGDLLLVAREVYGGTHALLALLHERHPEVNVERPRLEATVAAVERAPRPPAAVLVETPSNPLLGSVDLAALAAACRARGTALIVDNTFATPLLQTPLALGADLVVHSATKYLGGHSDVTAGLVAGGGALLARVRQAVRVGGACLDPHAAFLVGRGMKTLALRVERQSATAARLAELLAAHPAVASVRYPGRDPVAARQMRAGGGMLACELRGGEPAARTFLAALRLFQLIPSLGGVESGVGMPALTSHRGLPGEERRELGITDGLVRFSVGIEDPEDLLADVRRALGNVG
jgi:cystathionine beta-lyase/cystathionine gamma-synthase